MRAMTTTTWVKVRICALIPLMALVASACHK